MAEEKTEGAEGVVDTKDAPENELPASEGKGDEPSPYEPSPYDDLARQMGWTPRDEFKGDPEGWKTAEQFIRDGHDIQRQQGRDLREMRSTLDNISRTSAQILADRIEQEKTRLAQEYNAAVEDGDARKSFEIAQKIQGLDEQRPQPGKDETAAWIEKNPWYRSDPLAARVAFNVCEDLKHLPVSQQLEAAEREVRRVYPQLFNDKPSGKPPPGVNPPASRGTTTTPKEKGFADMPKAAQDIARDMVERKVIPNLESYATRYWADVAKSQGQAA